LPNLAQTAVDQVVARVARHTHHSTDSRMTSISYEWGWALLIPVWYLEMPGHALAAAVVSTFSNFAKYAVAGDPSRIDLAMSRFLSAEVILRHPRSIPTCITATFRAIQSTVLGRAELTVPD
jgi:hypothetical protein